MTAVLSKNDAAKAMDRIYRYQTAIYDMTRRPYLLGRDILLQELAPPDASNILEIACGTGRNLIVAAKLYPSCHLFGFDISNVMVTKARTSIERNGLADQIQIAKGNATDADSKALFKQGRFDRVYISYALSMIPPWREALAHALSLTENSGNLSIVDFGSAADQPRWIRPFLLFWLKMFGVTPQPDLKATAEALAQACNRPITVKRLWGGYAVLIVFEPVRQSASRSL